MAVESDRKPAAPEVRRRKRTALIALLTALALVLIAGGTAVIYLGSLATTFDTKTQKIPAAFPDESTRPKKTAPAASGSGASAPDGTATPINLLIAGSDSRGATTSTAEAGEPSDQRSDTMMLVHVPADRKNVYVVSIMRDLWVPIPGHGSAKINAALAFGGVPLMVETVESLLHQRIDHVVFMDFEGFKGLTDAVGGVDVNVTRPFASTMSENPGLPFTQGMMHMDGRTAVACDHERYAFSDGDYQRVRDQQAFLKALVGKIATPQTLANPMTLSNVVNEISPYLTVDSGFNSAAAASLGFELRAIRSGDIVTFTLPTKGTGWSTDGQSIVLFNEAATTGLADAMAQGTVPQFVKDNGLTNGN
ncbi:MAG: LCP family protein [Sinomonas sp.]|nr:LCP family protein [Sinomonas sp.]